MSEKSNLNEKNEESELKKINKKSYETIIKNQKRQKITIIILSILIILLASIIIKLRSKTILVNGFYNKISEKLNRLNYEVTDPLIKEGRSSIYELTRYPQISLIIPFFSGKLNEGDIIKYIQKLKLQKLKDFEVLLSFNKHLKKPKLLKKLNELIKNDKRFIISLNIDPKLSEVLNIFNIIFKSRGNLIAVSRINNSITENSLYRDWNQTLGKPDIVFEISNNTYIKKKYLIDYYDKYVYGESFNKSFVEIISEIKNSNFKINFIPICYSSDEGYAVLTYVSLISLLDSKHRDTFYTIYYIINHGYSSKSKKITLSLYEQFDNFNITFIELDNPFKGGYFTERFPESSYFRIYIPYLLPNLDKMIYLDGDTIIYKDLSPLYDKYFGDKALYGYLNKNNINSGVLLMNLKMLRKIDFKNKVINLIKSEEYKKTKIVYNRTKVMHDQEVINYVLKRKIGFFGNEFNARPISCEYILCRKEKNCKNISMVDDAFRNSYPFIRHYFGDLKPYNKKYKEIELTKLKKGYSKDWWYYGMKGKYYKEVLKLNK